MPIKNILNGILELGFQPVFGRWPIPRGGAPGLAKMALQPV
ncbi:hypothetical protein [Marinilabilia rubra]|nr:hypothetical protein [Marinilabilia rubra]